MKKIKYLLLVVLVSCAFVLSGCGDGQLGAKAEANIGNKEDYVAAEAADITALAEAVNDEEATGVAKYRMTMEMSMTEGEETMSMYFNSIIAVSETSYQMAIKMEQSGSEGKMGAKIYVTEDTFAMEATAGADEMEKFYGSSKIKLPLELAEEIGMDEMLTYLQTLDLSNLLAMVKAIDFEAEGVSVKVNTEDTTTRFEIVQTIEDETSTMYLVFENGVLNSCQVEVSMFGVPVKVVIEAFDGEIEFPNFDSFKDFSELMPE